MIKDVIMNRIGVVSCHLTGFEPGHPIIIEDAIERVAGYGLEEIEWFQPLWFEEQFGENVFSRIRTLCDKAGIQSSYHAPWQEEWDIAQIGFEKGKRAITRMMDMAEKIGAQAIIIHFGTYPLHNGASEESRAKALKGAVNVLMDSLHELEKRKMHICVENNTACHEANIIGERLDDFTYLFSRIHSQLVGLNLDVGHSNVTGDTDEYLSTLGHRLVHTHIHDTDGITDGHLPPGDGTIPWESFFSKLKEIHYSGPLIIEFPEASGQYQSFIEWIRKQSKGKPCG